VLDDFGHVCQRPFRAINEDLRHQGPRVISAGLYRAVSTRRHDSEQGAICRFHQIAVDGQEIATFTNRANDVGADPFLEPAEFLEFPEMLANERVVELDDPVVGRVRQVGPLANMSDTPARIERSAPLLGADTDAVLAAPRARTSPPVPPATPSPGPHALSGVTIVELAYYVAAPLASTLLAEMGARVIKVEPLAGDPSRRTGLQNAKFLVGKESIALDLKSSEGQAILHQLIGNADALLHSFRRGVPERLGHDYDTALSLNPRLVYVYGGSYGSRGPWNMRPAFHSTPNALCGGGFAQAGLGNPPADDSYPDPGSGLATATALMLGLWARVHTGRGQYVETSMISSAGYVHSDDLVLYDGRPPSRRPDKGQHGLHALYRLYECSDGWLFVAAWRDNEWAALARTLGHPEWLDDARFMSASARTAHDAELVAAISDALIAHDVDEWEALLVAADVAAVRVSDVPLETWFEREGLLLPEDHPVFGPFWRAPVKIEMSENPPRLAPVCGLGEHSRAILEELGYDRDAIEVFRSQLLADPALVGWNSYYACWGDALVGCGGYFGPPAAGAVEIGYAIGRPWRRQGLASELVGALVVRAAACGVERVVAHTRPDNAASMSVLAGNGFVEAAPDQPDHLRFELQLTSGVTARSR
jgi:crotonobetainyl-CoA:carnitine CoA-transferase CaiB-like acyl-CoA transferase